MTSAGPERDGQGEGAPAEASSGRARGGRARRTRTGRRPVLVRHRLRLGLGATLAWLTVQTVLEVGSLLTLLLLACSSRSPWSPSSPGWPGTGCAAAGPSLVVLVVLVAFFGGFLALVVPPVTDEVNALVKAVPGWLRATCTDHDSALGRFEDRYHVLAKIKRSSPRAGRRPVSPVACSAPESSWSGR